MSCFCVYTDDGDRAEFYTEKKVKARKSHKCSECKKEIRRGEIYERVTGKWDGEIDTYKTCKTCLNILNEFFCEGRIFGNMKWDLYENLQETLRYDGFPGECLAELEPEARKYVCEIIETIWKDWEDYE